MDKITWKSYAALPVLLNPFWFPIVISFILPKETSNELVLFLLFVMPAIATYPIFTAKGLPVLMKVFIIPAYYVLGIGMTFFLGWYMLANLYGP